jgi:cell division protein FtsL
MDDKIKSLERKIKQQQEEIDKLKKKVKKHKWLILASFFDK